MNMDAHDSISKYGPSSDQPDLRFKNESVIHFDPENRGFTIVLNKDLKRWKRKLEELKNLNVAWSGITFTIGTAGLSIIASFITKNTKFISITAILATICLALVIYAVLRWKMYESNIPSIAIDILTDLPKLSDGEVNESR